jgi:hypothetical protein
MFTIYGRRFMTRHLVLYAVTIEAYLYQYDVVFNSAVFVIITSWSPSTYNNMISSGRFFA